MTQNHAEIASTVVELEREDIEFAFPALKELRPNVTSKAEFVQRMNRQFDDGYRLVGARDEDGVVVAVAGFRTGNSLAWGKFLYVDDFSTVPAARRKGHARALLAWIDDEARRLGCEQVHLDSGTQRHDAHKRYLSSGFMISSLHFTKRVGH